MTAKLSEELLQALNESGDRPLQVIDPTTTSKQYILIAADVYDRVKPLIAGDNFDIRESYAGQFAAMDSENCWAAPGMELYDDYDARKSPS